MSSYHTRKFINCKENYENIDTTKIYGNYELTCKEFIKQTIITNFICFTDNENIVNNGWIINTTPYHNENKNELDDDTYIIYLSNNKLLI